MASDFERSAVLLTSEHSGNRVPRAYQSLFRGAEQILASHRGWDPGAKSLARVFRQHLQVELFECTVTRLLVEPNRSIGHPNLFSEFTRGLQPSAKQEILDRYYRPHRHRIESWIDHKQSQGWFVWHLSLHTFTPQWNGEQRNADIGLLYDPARKREKAFVDRWKGELHARCPELRIRRNYPYLGKADGLTTALRRKFGTTYAGIELEVNQSWVSRPKQWRRLCQTMAECYDKTVLFHRGKKNW